MLLLTWKFEWARRRACAVAPHGTYVVEGDEHNRWRGRFTRMHPGPCVTIRLPTRTAVFHDLAAAIHACQRHAELFSSESSDRLLVATPVP